MSHKTKIFRYSQHESWCYDKGQKLRNLSLLFSENLNSSLKNPPSDVTQKIYKLLEHLLQSLYPEKKITTRWIVRLSMQQRHVVTLDKDFGVVKVELVYLPQQMFNLFAKLYFYQFKGGLSAYYTEVYLGVLQFIFSSLQTTPEKFTSVEKHIAKKVFKKAEDIIDVLNSF